ncbi:stage V sporulation protein E [Chengkuizengella axinellae]|uniref:Stage V sporulation protein E n=1 Tax=Chengkuizengella axinellae TaxID=3064388 RepID=A0ABT9IUY8_9BACL|nr:stage V sporulation protein E [Chengkuizengella sp. 2205SS18-9]MDP5273156.1 stage V sporulation protein E [Chengkuizengella sp. 2205SS18-9]
MAKIRSAPDSLIIVSTLMLLGIGLIMVYSASAVLAFHNFGDSLFYLKRQFVFAVLGIFALFFTMNIDYWAWKKFAKMILISGFIMLILVLIIGDVRGGAKSWLGVGSLGIQPSEFMKLAVVLFLAKFLTDRDKEITLFVRGLMPPLLLVGAAFALIMLQPDLGTGAVLVGASLIVIYVAGLKISHLVGLAMIGVIGLVGLIITAPYRLKRITGFLDPWEDPLGTGYQIIQSLYAIGPGGLVGLGLGRSRQKYNYLPEPQTDFIFSIISEELGFIGGSVVLILFLILIWRGFRVAITAPDSFGSLLAVGIISIIGVQVMINIGVVIGMFPVTGITLPLISAGGSSLTLLLTAIGILLNISRYSR